MTTLILNGHIELLQPLTMSVPNKDAPSKHVHLMPFFDDTGTRQTLPTVPGHTIKGAMRSKGGMPALAEIYGADPADPQTWGVFSIQQVYNAQTGGLVTKSKTTAEDLVRARLNREQDVHNSVFGAMRLSMKGILEVDFAKPDTELYADQGLRSKSFGARRDPYRGDPGLLNRHSDAEVDAFVESLDENKRLSDLRKRAKAIDAKLLKLRGNKRRKDGDEGADEAAVSEAKILQAELDEINDEKKVLQEGGAESIGRTLDPLEYIAAGVRLNHEMRLVNASDVEIGYFLRCLAHFSNECRLGGKGGVGYGKVRFNYNIRIREGISTQEGGRLTLAPYEFDVDSTHPVIARANAAKAA
jgi:hypothetical protein